MSDAKSYGGTTPVAVIETHISLIFLAGPKAYKLKKAVKLPYVDFSTAALRLSACLKEIALNSVTAPGLYLGVKKLAKAQDGNVCFADDGTPLDAVVEMVRFEQDLLFDRLAAADKLTDALMTSTARMIGFHQTAAIAQDLDGRRHMEADP